MSPEILERYLPGPQWRRLRLEVNKKARKCANTRRPNGTGNTNSANGSAKEHKTQ